jgi:hypothetical protein
MGKWGTKPACWGALGPVVPAAVSLGVELHGNSSISSITAAVGQRLACMVATQSAMYHRLREMHVTYNTYNPVSDDH